MTMQTGCVVDDSRGSPHAAVMTMDCAVPEASERALAKDCGSPTIEGGTTATPAACGRGSTLVAATPEGVEIYQS